MSIKAVIFDLDGTIIDSEYYFVKRTLKFAEDHHFNMSHEDAISLVGLSYHDYLKNLSKVLNHDFMEIKKLFDKYKEIHPVPYGELINTDAYDLIKYLKNSSYRLALATSTYRNMLDVKLSSIGLIDFFEVEISGDMFEKAKPDPQIYIECVKRLALKPEECIAIEDSEVGIKSAHDAGLYVIARKNEHFDTDQSLADIIVDDLRKTIELFKEGEQN